MLVAIEPHTVIGGLDHGHLFEYNERTNKYDCVDPKCYGHVPNPIPGDVKHIRRGDYMVVLDRER